MKKLYAVLLSIFLPIFILLSSVQFFALKKGNYSRNFRENNIVLETGRTMDELEVIAEDLISYLKLEDIDLNKHFNAREVAHMEDVKVLFKKGYILMNISFLLSVLSILGLVLSDNLSSKDLELVNKGFFLWWLLILLISILSLIDFQKYFTYFHLIFFDNDLWLLDPNKDLMIQMLPEIFFKKIFIAIVLTFLMLLIISHLSLRAIKRKILKREKVLGDA